MVSCDFSTSGRQAALNRWEEAELTEEQGMETTAAGPRGSVSVNLARCDLAGRIAYLRAGLLIGRVVVVYQILIARIYPELCIDICFACSSRLCATWAK